MNSYSDSGKIAYKRNRYYNPKVHVDGWYDIQNDEKYIEKYNEMKRNDLEYYPKPIIPEINKKTNFPKKNKSVKEVIFYQNYGTESWVTENQAAFTQRNKL